MSIPGAASPLFIGAAAAEAAAFQIDRSIRLNSADSAYLNRTPSSAGNRKTWTWSSWVKFTKFSQASRLFAAGANNDNRTIIHYDSSNNKIKFYSTIGGAVKAELTTDAVLRDPSSFYHIVVAFDAANTNIDIYLNGVELTFNSAVAVANENHNVNNTVAHKIGQSVDGNVQADFYLAETHFVDGQALAASDFGEYDDNNVWQPKDCKDDLTYGTNGFYLKFNDNSSNSALGTDDSGNNNDFTVNNITANSSALQSQTWSDNITTTGNSGTFHSSYPATNAFNGNDSNYAHGNGDGSQTAVVTLTLSPGVSCSNTVSFFGGMTGSGTATIAVNGGTAVNLTSGSSATTQTDVSFSGTVTSIVVTKTSSDASGMLIYGFKIDGVRLVDSGVAYTAAADTDSLIDTPTNYTADSGNNGGNYATWNPLQTSAATLSNGNLDLTSTGALGCRSTFAASSGKWYFEVTCLATGGGGSVGVMDYDGAFATGDPGNQSYGWGFINTPSNSNFTKKHNNSASTMSSPGALAVGDVFGVAYDLDSGKIWFSKNGTYGEGDPSAGTGASYTNLSGTVGPAAGNGSSVVAWAINAGQRSFSYTPPTNFLSLCTQNLSDPTIADGSTAFDIDLYTGTNASLERSNFAFSPDLLWFKSRNAARTHVLIDTVRGRAKALESNNNATEFTSDANRDLVSFDSDGFTVGQTQNFSSVNRSGDSICVWAWDAGTSTASNTDGSITSNVRANTSAGFSIVGYTGTGTAGTIGHGLNAAPEFIIVKNRDTARPWSVFHQSITNMSSGYLNLNLANAFTGSYTGVWNGTDPTSSVFSVGTDNESNNSGDDFIAYCWTPVSQYSSFGVYTGNGASNGPFVFLGFRPRFLLYKRTDAADTVGWILTDSERNTYNVIDDYLSPTTNAAEGTTDIVDFLSNGFKMRIAGADGNVSGGTYVYAAFAEHPLATSRAR